MSNKEENKRYSSLIVIMVVLFSVLICRLAYLQIVKNEYYLNKAKNKNNKTISIAAPRGEIYDRNGEVLASNRQGFSLIFTETSESKAQFFITMDKVFELLEDRGERISDTFQLKVTPFELETTSEVAELRFKKDRGFDYYIMREKHKGKKLSDLSEEEIEAIDKELLEMTPEEVFRALIKEYSLYEILSEEYTDEEWVSLKKEKSTEELIDLLLDTVDHETIRKYMIIKDTMKMQSFQGHRPVVIANDLKLETAYMFEQIKSDVPGISILSNSIRYYPKGEVASGVIGYIGKIDPYYQEKYKLKGYNIYEDYIGKAGMEEEFEEILRGVRGEESIQVNKYGSRVKTLGIMTPIPGDNIQLTIDWKIQAAAEKAIDETLAQLRELKDKNANGDQDDVNKQNATRGAAVVIDVNSGEVLALASRPGYDPNLFTVPGRLSSEESKKYFNPDLESFGREYIKSSGLLRLESFGGEDISKMGLEEKQEYLLNKIFPMENGYRKDNSDIYPRPFYNYATKSLIPPGSIFKMMTGIAGLSEGVITPEEEIYDAGPYNKRYKSYMGASWMYNVHKSSHGNQNLAEAIMDSNNYYFYEVADRLFAKEGVTNGFATKEGLDMIAKYAYKFGLGADPNNSSEFTTGIEISEFFGQVYGYDYGKKKHSVDYTRAVYDYLSRGTSSLGHVSFTPIDIIPDEVDDPSKEVFDIKKELTEEIKSQMTSEDSIDLTRTKMLIETLIETDTRLQDKYSESDINKMIISIESSVKDARTEMRSGTNLYNASIGQGMNNFTPLQLANYVATIANGGNKYELHLVKKIIDDEDNTLWDSAEKLSKPEESGVSTEVLDAVKEGMLMVTTQGTASRLKDFPISSGGKTGSATYKDNQEELGRTAYATYVGFAPFENPEIAVCVVLFDGGHGGYTVPIVQSVYEEYFREELIKIDPDYEFKYNFE